MVNFVKINDDNSGDNELKTDKLKNEIEKKRSGIAEKRRKKGRKKKKKGKKGTFAFPFSVHFERPFSGQFAGWLGSVMR